MLHLLTLRRTLSQQRPRCGPNRILLGRRNSSVSSEASASAAGCVAKQKETNSFVATAAASIACVSLSIGFAAGRYSAPPPDNNNNNPSILPNGLPRTCCDDEAPLPLTEVQFHLPEKLQKIVGQENVLDGRQLDTRTTSFLKGARLGFGPALCIVTPRQLHHVVDVVEAAVQAGCVVLPQGQNTGLTGGSVPHTHDPRRPVVLLSMKHLDAIFPLDDGKRVVCLAGVGLASVRQWPCAMGVRMEGSLGQLIRSR